MYTKRRSDACAVRRAAEKFVLMKVFASQSRRALNFRSYCYCSLQAREKKNLLETKGDFRALSTNSIGAPVNRQSASRLIQFVSQVRRSSTNQQKSEIVRQQRDLRSISIGFVRFRSISPFPPFSIVYSRLPSGSRIFIQIIKFCSTNPHHRVCELSACCSSPSHSVAKRAPRLSHYEILDALLRCFCARLPPADPASFFLATRIGHSLCELCAK